MFRALRRLGLGAFAGSGSLLMHDYARAGLFFRGVHGMPAVGQLRVRPAEEGSSVPRGEVDAPVALYRPKLPVPEGSVKAYPALKYSM